MKKYTGLTAFIVSSYWQVFRINFVVFSLYLMGHAFYIWDGFREYGSFTDFLLSISLASILWTIIAAVTALLLWLPALLRATMWPFRRVDLKIKIGELLLFAGIFILIGLFTWKFKKLIWPDVTTSVHIKLIVFMCLAVVSGFITRLLHSNTVERCVDVIQERIAPLVWLFGVYLVLSVPSIAYYTWFNIILVTFDALTARDMSLYGYRRETTPFISKWAKNASIFTMAEASSDYTRPTTASLMTGKRVWTHQLYRAHGVINGAKENLPLLLKNSGYYNIALVQNHLASVETFGISKSFDTAPNASYFMEPLSLDGTIDKHLFKLFGSKFRIYNIFESQGFITKKILSLTRREVSMTEYPPGIIFSKLLEIVNDNSIEPFFAWLHILPPHDPYIAPEPYMGMFDPSQRLRTNDLSAGKLSDERICNEEDREIYRARYDEFIRYCDKKFEDFVSQVSKTNRLKNTVVILSADHGESFEHGVLTHGSGDLYEQLTNIPLIIKEPGATGGRIINNVVEQVDIPPTILELADIPVPSWMEGRSLIPLMRGKELPSRYSLSMHIEGIMRNRHKIMEGTFAVWEGDYKLIYYLKDNKSLLFNLRNDPDEINNIFEKDAETGGRLLSFIKSDFRKANERIGKGE